MTQLHKSFVTAKIVIYNGYNQGNRLHANAYSSHAFLIVLTFVSNWILMYFRYVIFLNSVFPQYLCIYLIF